MTWYLVKQEENFTFIYYTTTLSKQLYLTLIHMFLAQLPTAPTSRIQIWLDCNSAVERIKQLSDHV